MDEIIFLEDLHSIFDWNNHSRYSVSNICHVSKLMIAVIKCVLNKGTMFRKIRFLRDMFDLVVISSLVRVFNKLYVVYTNRLMGNRINQFPMFFPAIS